MKLTFRKKCKYKFKLISGHKNRKALQKNIPEVHGSIQATKDEKKVYFSKDTKASHGERST